MIRVVDASVAVKWFLRSAPYEDHGDVALDILEEAVDGSIDLRQPPHSIAEVAGALARLNPDGALLDVRDLLLLDFEPVDEPEIYAVGTDLAIELDQHVFDTLYHPVALTQPEAVLITADRRYYASAHSVGQIALLDEATDA